VSLLRQSKPMQRKSPLRARPVEGRVLPKRKCKVCSTVFVPYGIASWYSPECGTELALDKLAKKKAKDAAADRALTRQQLLDLKPLKYWAKRAEKDFNAFVRARDEGDACISCATYDADEWHAGHFYTVKARPDLRFNEDNVHLQCGQCNLFESGNVSKYRPRLKAKIGAERFAALVPVDPAFKKTREYYQAVEAKYKAKLKELRQGEPKE
jgi:hypothetical protein